MTALKPQKSDHLLVPPQNTHQPARRGANEAYNALQSVSILPTEYGSSLDTRTARSNVMYALNELFRFAAMSECQFINFMALQVAQEMATFESHMMHSLQNLQYSKRLIADHIAYLSDIVTFLKTSSGLHARSGDETPNEVDQEIKDSLLQDFEDLIGRARDLAARCLEGASDITSRARLEQSSQAMDESKRVNRLTLLAFFFLPLNLGTGLFGMNFKQLGTGILSVWVCVPVFVLIISISMVVAFPQRIGKMVLSVQRVVCALKSHRG